MDDKDIALFLKFPNEEKKRLSTATYDALLLTTMIKQRPPQQMSSRELVNFIQSYVDSDTLKIKCLGNNKILYSTRSPIQLTGFERKNYAAGVEKESPTFEYCKETGEKKRVGQCPTFKKFLSRRSFMINQEHALEEIIYPTGIKRDNLIETTLNSIECLKDYLPPYICVDPKKVLELGIIKKNTFKFPLLFLLDSFENCLAYSFMYPAVELSDLRMAKHLNIPTKKYMISRIAMTVYLFSNAIAFYLRKNYMNDRLAIAIENESVIAMADYERREGCLLFLYQHLAECVHGIRRYGNFIESLFSSDTIDELYEIVKDNEIAELAKDGYLTNNRALNIILQNSKHISHYTFWWDYNSFFPNGNDINFETTERFFTEFHKKKITFNNIFIPASTFYRLWPSLFLLSVVKNSNKAPSLPQTLSFKDLLINFIIKHLYVMMGCPRCMSGFQFKLAESILLCKDISDVDQLHQSNVKGGEEVTTDLKLLEKYRIISSTPGYNSKLDNNVIYPTNVYLAEYVIKIMHESYTIINSDEENVHVAMMSYLFLFFLVLASDEYQTNVIGPQKRETFPYINDQCQLISFWFLRNAIRITNHKNIWPMYPDVMEKCEIEKFTKELIMFFKKYPMALEEFHNHIKNIGIDHMIIKKSEGEENMLIDKYSTIKLHKLFEDKSFSEMRESDSLGIFTGEAMAWRMMRKL